VSFETFCAAESRKKNGRNHEKSKSLLPLCKSKMVPFVLLCDTLGDESAMNNVESIILSMDGEVRRGKNFVGRDREPILS